MTGNTFGVAICKLSSTVFQICNVVISKDLPTKYMPLSKRKKKMSPKVLEFGTKYGMTQAFGCVVGTHVPVQCPSENSQDSYC